MARGTNGCLPQECLRQMRTRVSSLPCKRWEYALLIRGIKVFKLAYSLSSDINARTAFALRSISDFPEAAKIFEDLIKENPHRLDSLDVFSNVLFVTESRARLSFLAHSCAMTDNYRPETCCIIGEYVQCCFIFVCQNWWRWTNYGANITSDRIFLWIPFQETITVWRGSMKRP